MAENLLNPTCKRERSIGISDRPVGPKRHHDNQGMRFSEKGFLLSSLRVGLVFASSMMVGCIQATSGQDIVKNGSFEEVTFVPLRIDPWVGVKWEGLLTGSPYASHGANFITVEQIYQDLNTDAGQTYLLSFHVAADLYLGPSVQVLAWWGGKNIGSFTTVPHTYDPQGYRFAQTEWERFDLQVTGLGPKTRLEFQGGSGTPYLLDDVRVVAIPEPATLSLWGVAAIFAAVKLVRKHITPEGSNPGGSTFARSGG